MPSSLRRRVPVLALVLSCLTSAATAQGSEPRLGVFAGVGMSRLSGPGLDEIVNVRNRVGPHLGAFAELALNRTGALRPEVALVMRGVKFGEGDSDVTLTTSWIEVPLLAKVAFPSSGSGGVRPHLYAGPAVAFNLNCTVEGDVNNTQVSRDCDEIDAAIKSTEVSVILGGGLDFGRLSLGARYTLGLTDLNDASDATSDDAARSRTISILVGYALRLGGR